MAASMVACATGGKSGLPFLFSAKGKLNRMVATPASARDSLSEIMKEWFIPAPAPCARVIMHLLLDGIMHSADTSPMVGETLRAKDLDFDIKGEVYKKI